MEPNRQRYMRATVLKSCEMGISEVQRRDDGPPRRLLYHRVKSNGEQVPVGTTDRLPVLIILGSATHQLQALARRQKDE